MSARSPRRSVLFITSCPEIWGGSEELWAGAAVELHKRGYRVIAGRTEPVRKWRSHPRWKELKAYGIDVGGFRVPTLFRAIPDAAKRYLPALWPATSNVRNSLLSAAVRHVDPDLVVLSQGNTYDGIFYVDMPLIFRNAGKPYVLISQKNAETQWPYDETRLRSLKHFESARAVYFVSEHNRRTAEHQLGMKVANAEVVRNPFKIGTLGPLPWPAGHDDTVRFACVGRLYVREKGQDLLLNVLARPKWRQRPVELNIYGEGNNAEALAGMARLLGLDNVRFHGFSSDVTQVWRENHALVLPSRAEGLALAQVEAMICGRVPIVCPAGGAGEILEDNVTGFIASASTADALDEAMERAWARRTEWPEIGRKSSESVWRYFPRDPCSVFADKLEALM